MYVYKVMVGVELINELFRKSGGGGGSLFKEGYLNLLKIGHKQLFFKKKVH